MTVKNIIFDLGGVILDLDFERFYSREDGFSGKNFGKI